MLETAAFEFLDGGKFNISTQLITQNILYYTILYYTILYYTILYYTILYYTVEISLSPKGFSGLTYNNVWGN